MQRVAKGTDGLADEGWFMKSFAERRPFAGSPVLDDDVAKLAWLDAGANCLSWFRQPDNEAPNPEELALAVGFCLWKQLQSGGFTAWLFYRTGGVVILDAAVSSLSRIGAFGMAGHIDRALNACLGAPGLWRGLRGTEWDAYLQNRMHVLSSQFNPENAMLRTARISLREMAMTRDEWFGFIFACEKELAETGESSAYRHWFEVHRLRQRKWGRAVLERFLYWLRGDSRPISEAERAHRIQVVLDEEIEESHYCYSFDDPLHAGDMGYHYWEPEFLGKSYDFALAHIDCLRPSFRPA